MKIANIVGARPQFVKYFPISKAIERFNENSGNILQDILIHTGQHYDYAMSDIFFQEFGSREPDYHLEVGSGSHANQTGEILRRVEEVLIKEQSNVVIVYGDTNSTLAGALAAVKLLIPVVHIEAGLRSYNKKMPEEINRVLTDHSSTLLHCPTENAVKNLKKEGFENIANEGKLIDNLFDFSSYQVSLNNPLVCNVGDVMYDALLTALEIASEKSSILERLKVQPKSYYLLTIHRAENTDKIERLEELLRFVKESAFGKIVIFPVHPRTKKVLKYIPSELLEGIKEIEPVGYFDMLWLTKNSELVLTDSGGLQKEAYGLMVPCITLREETEWIETIQSGWNVLYKEYSGRHNIKNADSPLYGDGKAAEKVVYTIINTLMEARL